MSENKKIIASLSISGEITLNLHSLNNEGGEGNQIITRQLTIIDKNGEEHTVNGISGDMFKHIHVGHLINLAKEKSLELCSNCQVFNPNRLSSGEDLGKQNLGDASDKDIVDAIIKLCVVDDTHGVLVTKIGNKNKNVPRKSVVEFAWTVGIPHKNNTESYIHTKLVADASDKGSGSGSNEGQNIFHRPANHGAYAFICSIDVFRIGFNDISRNYPINDDARQGRYKAIIKALLSSFINPRGAMTSTQKPHITDFKGVVAVSNKLTPAPTISALNDGYVAEIKKIADNINRIEQEAISILDFNGLGDLSKILADLMDYEPYQIA
ncbi:MAG: DevR family CRISPR-associated autoregulator [Bacteroidia bacterium]